MHCRIRSSSAVIRKAESKDSFQSIQIDVFLEPDHVLVHVTHILGVDENKGEFRIQADCQNILNILVGESCKLNDISAFFEEIFLVIRDLNDERHFEGVLEVFIEDEGQHMAQMQCFRRGTATSIQIEGR